MKITGRSATASIRSKQKVRTVVGLMTPTAAEILCNVVMTVRSLLALLHHR
uniref:Uncharacterized protein n=1 Tax=Parascaris equorum TaxID=6256 RepID=A0A914RA39_PAREQ